MLNTMEKNPTEATDVTVTVDGMKQRMTMPKDVSAPTAEVMKKAGAGTRSRDTVMKNLASSTVDAETEAKTWKKIAVIVLVFAIFLLGGMFGLTLWAIQIQKELYVQDGTITDGDNNQLHTKSADFDVQGDGTMVAAEETARRLGLDTGSPLGTATVIPAANSSHRLDGDEPGQYKLETDDEGNLILTGTSDTDGSRALSADSRALSARRRRRRSKFVQVRCSNQAAQCPACPSCPALSCPTLPTEVTCSNLLDNTGSQVVASTRSLGASPDPVCEGHDMTGMLLHTHSGFFVTSDMECVEYCNKNPHCVAWQRTDRSRYSQGDGTGTGTDGIGNWCRLYREYGKCNYDKPVPFTHKQHRAMEPGFLTNANVQTSTAVGAAILKTGATAPLGPYVCGFELEICQCFGWVYFGAMYYPNDSRSNHATLEQMKESTYSSKYVQGSINCVAEGINHGAVQDGTITPDFPDKSYPQFKWCMCNPDNTEREGILMGAANLQVTSRKLSSANAEITNGQRLSEEVDERRMTGAISFFDVPCSDVQDAWTKYSAGATSILLKAAAGDELDLHTGIITTRFASQAVLVGYVDEIDCRTWGEVDYSACAGNVGTASGTAYHCARRLDGTDRRLRGTALNICFPSSSMVQTQAGVRSIADLGPGDTLDTSRDFESLESGSWLWDVHGSMGPKQSEVLAEFLAIKHTVSNQTLKLTADHMLFIKKQGLDSVQMLPAGDVRAGDSVFVTDPVAMGRLIPADVVDIQEVVEPGVYAPFTWSGRLIVDGVLVSNYAVFSDTFRATYSSHSWLPWERMMNLLNPFRYYFGAQLDIFLPDVECPTWVCAEDSEATASGVVLLVWRLSDYFIIQPLALVARTLERLSSISSGVLGGDGMSTRKEVYVGSDRSCHSVSK